MKTGISINQSQGIASQLCNVHNSTHRKGLHVPIYGFPLKSISARSLIRQNSTNPSLYINIIYHKLKVRALKALTLFISLIDLFSSCTESLSSSTQSFIEATTLGFIPWLFEIFTTIMVEVDLADDHVLEYLSFIWNFFFSPTIPFPKFWGPLPLGGLRQWPNWPSGRASPKCIKFFEFHLKLISFFPTTLFYQNFGAPFPLGGLRQ